MDASLSEWVYSGINTLSEPSLQVVNHIKMEDNNSDKIFRESNYFGLSIRYTYVQVRYWV